MNYCLAIKYNSKYSCKKSPNRSTPQRHRRKTYKGVTHSNNYGSSPLYTTARQIDQVIISHIDHVPWYVTIDRYIALTYVSYVNVVATFERQRQTVADLLISVMSDCCVCPTTTPPWKRLYWKSNCRIKATP